MIEIHVCREGGSPTACATNDPLLNWGPNISDSLLSTDKAALERGRVEIERSYTNRKIISLDILKLDFNQPNQLTAITDIFSNEQGLLNSFSLAISRSGSKLSVKASATVETQV